MDNPANGHGGPVTRPPDPSKPILRARLRSARAAYAPRAIPVHIGFLRRLAPGLVVAAYAPIGSEADPMPFVRAAAEAGCHLALPHITDRASPLRFLAWDAEAALHPGPFGLRQPRGDAAEVRPDIVLTPLVGFDRAGHRLGQGAGHYDRAFAGLPDAWRIGIAYAVQEAVLSPDPWDMPLHAVATDIEWIEPR